MSAAGPRDTGLAVPATLAPQRWGLSQVRLCADQGESYCVDQAGSQNSSDQAESQTICSYHTFVRSQCWEESGLDGKPARRCRRTLEKFRDCGRCGHVEAELVELVFGRKDFLTIKHAAGAVRTSKLSQRKWWTLID